MACINNMCAIINEAGPNDCNETIDCGQHTECQNEQCRVVDGAGENECSDVSECVTASSAQSFSFGSSLPNGSHTVCQNNACIEIPGNGRDECDVVLGCAEERTRCVNNACTISDDPGANECSSIIDCNEHTECRNNQCTVVAGNGQNQCANINDCLAASSSSPLSIPSSSSMSSNTSVSSSSQSSSRRSIPFLHLECVDQACVYVEGNERDSCDRGSTTDCLGSSRSSTPPTTIPPTPSSSERSTIIATVPPSQTSSTRNVPTISVPGVPDVTEPLVAAASVCGNGVLENKEECDDTNRRDNDGCSSTCLLEIGICGDGIVQSLLGEQCEQSTHDVSLGYTCNRCRFVSLFCGDNTLDPGEECDDGPQNSTSPDALCRPDCSLSRCGDGVLDSTELCDDGNAINNDGCDRYCLIEDGINATQVAGEVTIPTPYPLPPTPVGFPQYPNFQQLPYQLPLAQLQPLMQRQAPIGDTGPAAVAVVASGMAAGIGWIRRKKRK